MLSVDQNLTLQPTQILFTFPLNNGSHCQMKITSLHILEEFG